jgi:hypothetical protein
MQAAELPQPLERWPQIHGGPEDPRYPQGRRFLRLHAAYFPGGEAGVEGDADAAGSVDGVVAEPAAETGVAET